MISSPITPLHSAGSAQSSTEPSAAVGGSFASELAASERASCVDVLRSEPPTDVLEQVAAAAGVHEQLGREDREVRFSLLEPHGVRIELLEADGARTLSAAQALELGRGSSLE
jgi:hypothetical protein